MTAGCRDTSAPARNNIRGYTMAKGFMGLIIAMIITVIAANLAFRAQSSTDEPEANAPWSQDRMQFVAWNGNHWTAWINDSQFVQTPETTGRWSSHTKPGIAYIDWDGENWQAKVSGEEFIIAYRGNWSGPTERVPAIRYQDWAGRNQLRTVGQLNR